MGRLLAYSGLTTKIRAMESRLITDNGFRMISEMKDIPSLAAYLKHQPAYEKLLAEMDENQLHRGQLEQLLRYSIYDGFTKIYRFANDEQRRFLNLYFKRYEVSALKRCFRMVYSNQPPEVDLRVFEPFFEKHSDLNVVKISSSHTLEELVSNLAGSGYYPALSAMQQSKKNPTLFDLEMALDLYYFAYIWKVKDKILTNGDLKSITRAYGSKFDMINLNWIARSRQFYHMSDADVYAMLIPLHYKISQAEIRSLVEANSMDEFSARLAGTYYARKYSMLNTETLEDMYVYVLKHVLMREAQNHPYSVAIIYAYLYEKEHEVDRLITAMECIRYQLSPGEIYRYIVKY